MKKCLSLLACVAFLLALATTVLATQPKVVDDAGLLSAEQIALLEVKAQSMADEYEMDVAIVTVWSLDGKSSEGFADDYFDYNGYGVGSDRSGVLLLLAMEHRDWAISTCGQAIYALPDPSIRSVFSQIAGYLSADEYYLALEAYLNTLEPYLEAYAVGTPADGHAGAYTGPGTYIPGTQDQSVHYAEEAGFRWSAKKFLIALAVGVIAAAVTLLIMRRRMNTARKQRGADSYMKPGSYALNRQHDIFLYSQVHKVRRAENNTGGGGHRGGGSGIHRSSSGRSHGGSHGKF